MEQIEKKSLLKVKDRHPSPQWIKILMIWDYTVGTDLMLIINENNKYNLRISLYHDNKSYCLYRDKYKEENDD